MLVEAFSLSSVPQYLRFYSRVDILSARWKALSVCLLVTKCTYNCQNHRVIILITRWIRAITLPTFCRLVLPPKIKTSKWGLDPPFTIKSSKWGLDIISPIKASFWGLDTALVSCPHFEGMNSEIKATLCRFDLRLGFVGWFYSLPFIRNHCFARNGTKGWIFKDFRVFSKAFHEMPKKETVNLSLKNANLCLGFALVHFILTNHFAAKGFSLTTVTRFLRGW
jgi:hypothetical protein